MHPIDHARLARIKPSFVTRRMDLSEIRSLDSEAEDLKPGDLVLARVEAIGQHARIERPDGRRALLFPGDEILVACGARYAPDQFEAACPSRVGPANLVAAGGIAGVVEASHGQMKPATGITILGAVCDREGGRLTVGRYGVRGDARPVRIPVLAVCGTSMNAGKTHTVASMVRGYAQAGYRVAAIKVTGTGAGGDLWFYGDSGAHHVADFTDAGFATTYRTPVETIFEGLCRLLHRAEREGAEVVVLEVADGLYQAETAALLALDRFRMMLSAVVFAAGDAMGARAGAAWLREAGLPLRAVSGLMTRSPLAMRELREAIDLPCLTAEELADPGIVARLGPFEVSVRSAA